MDRWEYIKEIKKHILLGKIENVYSVDLTTKTKMDKTLTFPSFEQIIAYVNSANNSEKFILRIQESLNKHKDYILTNDRISYIVSLEPLNKRLEISHNLINKLLKHLNRNIKFNTLDDYKIEKIVSLSFDASLVDLMIQLDDLLLDLTVKIKKHLIANSIYGKGYIVNYQENIKIFKSSEQIDLLSNAINKVKKVLEKKYFVDFLSDGIEELHEMLEAFWYSISVLIYLSKPSQFIEYIVESERVNNIEIWLKNKVKNIYYSLDELMKNDDIFDVLSDVQIRDAYEKIIKIKIPKEVNPRKESDITTKKCKAEQRLDELIGLETVKEMIEKIKAYTLANKDSNSLNLHMAFYGNPGTGKTEVAKLIGEILYEYGVLPKKSYIEATRTDLVGQFIGWTGKQTKEIIEKAMGGVLFIDEAYSLAIDGDSIDFGHEAVAELIQAMEKYKGKFCVILAGYKNPLKKMLATNPGFNSRIQFHIDFQNYSRDELDEIFKLIISKEGYLVNDDALVKMLDVTDLLRKNVDFANARDVRNIIQQCIMNLSLRTGDSNDRTITIEDVDKYIKDSKIGISKKSDSQTKVLTADEELERLIGLSNVKTNIKKIRAYAKKNKNSEINLHMAFAGNPGTGKTEVANIISRILYDAGVLPEAKVVVANREKLVAGFVGQTAKQTKEIIEKAMGGVLFIDEAYSLAAPSSGVNDYGYEAIATLIEEMENNKGKFCVILAGYDGPLKQMISTNPGFSSRIQFWINFPDYSKEELRSIAELFLKDYEFENEALDLLIEIAELYRYSSNFANARTIRKIIQDVILNQNMRTEDDLNNNLIIIDDVKQYIIDNNLNVEFVEEKKSLDETVLNDLIVSSFSYDNSNSDIKYYEQSVISISGIGNQGTGFIVTPNGIGLTCAHCIKGDTLQKARIVLYLADGQKFNNYVNFEVLFIDTKNDFAVIKLDNIGMNYKFIPLTLEKDILIEPLKKFIMAGYPFGGETFSSISITNGTIASINNYKDRKIVFSDMFGKSGNSGSPIIDEITKKVIGIFFGGISTREGNEEINCFTPIDEIWSSIRNK